jgi:hypothetical protein
MPENEQTADGQVAEGGNGDGTRDEDRIPKSRVDDMIASVKRDADIKLARLEGELAALKQPVKTVVEAPKNRSRAELRREVEEGVISEDEMDEILYRQSEERISQRVSEQVRSKSEEDRRVERHNAEMASYKALAPDAFDDGTELRGKIAAEYRSLVELGSPDSYVTELVALRTVLGPADRLQRGKRTTEAFQDGSVGGSQGNGLRTDGIPKELTERQIEHYAQRVGPGKLYPDWKAVQDELAYAKPRERAGART